MLAHVLHRDVRIDAAHDRFIVAVPGGGHGIRPPVCALERHAGVPGVVQPDRRHTGGPRQSREAVGVDLRTQRRPQLVREDVAAVLASLPNSKSLSGLAGPVLAQRVGELVGQR